MANFVRRSEFKVATTAILSFVESKSDGKTVTDRLRIFANYCAHYMSKNCRLIALNKMSKFRRRRLVLDRKKVHI